ncbi:MAG: 2OG-Fe(II) oxygenase [Paracoccaceae bacterium]
MRDILDLDRYPLDRPDSLDWQALVASAKGDLADHGMFNLQGLLQPSAIAEAVAELSPRFDTESFTHARKHNIYFRKDMTDVPPDHPALRQFETVNRTLCGDQIGGVIRQLYEWPDFARFLAATMDKPVLHTMDDPLARVNAMAYGNGEALNWHFDRSEFTTTLLLQAPEAGGDFEYRTDLRSDGDPNYDGVGRLLAGNDPDVQCLKLSAGTLNVFKGKNTAHRVTPVKGDRPRIITVFSFYERPGVRFSEDEQIGFYGRAA